MQPPWTPERLLDVVSDDLAGKAVVSSPWIRLGLGYCQVSVQAKFCSSDSAFSGGGETVDKAVADLRAQIERAVAKWGL